MSFKPFLLLSTLLIPVVAQAADDTRVQKTVLLEKITFKPVAEAKPDEVVLSDKKSIYLSPNSAKLAVRAKSAADQNENMLLDGKAGPGYQAITPPVWDKNNNLLYIGHRAGKDYVVKNSGEIASTAADEIRSLSPLDYSLNSGLNLDASSANTPALYAKRTGNVWQVWSPVEKISKDSWANVTGIWPSSSSRTAPVAYEVTGGAGSSALLQDGGSLGGARSIFDGVAVAPVWSPDGKHIAYSVGNAGADYISVDGRPLSTVNRAPQFSWSPKSNRLLVWGRELKTFTIDFDAAGRLSLGKVVAATPFVDGDANNGVVWSGDGTHWTFFAPALGEIYLDGARKVTIPHGTEYLSQVALDQKGTNLAYSYAVGESVGVKADNYDAPGFASVQGLRFSDVSSEPLFLAQKAGKTDKSILNWSLHCLGEDIVFLSTQKDKAEPLTNIISLGSGNYRIVMLETEAENSKLVRYDIKMGR